MRVSEKYRNSILHMADILSDYFSSKTKISEEDSQSLATFLEFSQKVKLNKPTKKAILVKAMEIIESLNTPQYKMGSSRKLSAILSD